jgi:hypothetical protein
VLKKAFHLYGGRQFASNHPSVFREYPSITLPNSWDIAVNGEVKYRINK